jgi:hypothetical protein
LWPYAIDAIKLLRPSTNHGERFRAKGVGGLSLRPGFPGLRGERRF